MEGFEKIKDRIAKLLKLAESPNEHEAKAALIKAKKFMMENKLEMNDINFEEKNVVKINTEITFNSLRNSWLIDLSSLIAKNYCCVTFYTKKYNKKNNEVVLCGFEEDVSICNFIFKYAYDCIEAWCKNLKKEMKRNGYPNLHIKKCCNGYASGFVVGLEESYKKQAESNQEWGLVALIPKEVENVVESMGCIKMKVESEIDTESYFVGLSDGKHFSTRDRLTEAI